MKTVIRVMYLLGLAALSVAAIHAINGDSEVWFSQAIYLAAAFTATILIILWGISELAMKFISKGWLRIILLFMTVSAVLVPSIYVGGGAFFGETKAEYNTWHLLSLFAVMYQVFGVVVGVVMGSAVAVVVSAARALIAWLRSVRSPYRASSFGNN